MNNRAAFIWIGFFIGSTIGSLIPALWGAGAFSAIALFFGPLGGLVGIWLAYKYTG